jgi:hypothetical protein
MELREWECSAAAVLSRIEELYSFSFVWWTTWGELGPPPVGDGLVSTPGLLVNHVRKNWVECLDSWQLVAGEGQGELLQSLVCSFISEMTMENGPVGGYRGYRDPCGYSDYVGLFALSSLWTLEFVVSIAEVGGARAALGGLREEVVGALAERYDGSICGVAALEYRVDSQGWEQVFEGSEERRERRERGGWGHGEVDRLDRSRCAST